MLNLYFLLHICKVCFKQIVLLSLSNPIAISAKPELFVHSKRGHQQGHQQPLLKWLLMCWQSLSWLYLRQICYHFSFILVSVSFYLEVYSSFECCLVFWTQTMWIVNCKSVSFLYPAKCLPTSPPPSPADSQCQWLASMLTAKLKQLHHWLTGKL